MGPNDDNGFHAESGSDLRANGDLDLSGLVGHGVTHDAAVLEFDLVSTNSLLLEFQYVFASEEYTEYIGAPPDGFNDPMAIFVSTNYNGTNWIIDATNNIALVPGTNRPVTINTINGGGTNALSGLYVPPTNPQYYVDNGDPLFSTNAPVFNIQYDGTTTLLTAQIQITPNVPHHIKIAIADYGDYVFDSAILIKAAPPFH